jgi:hypothetical protein
MRGWRDEQSRLPRCCDTIPSAQKYHANGFTGDTADEAEAGQQRIHVFGITRNFRLTYTMSHKNYTYTRLSVCPWYGMVGLKQ